MLGLEGEIHLRNFYDYSIFDNGTFYIVVFRILQLKMAPRNKNNTVTSRRPTKCHYCGQTFTQFRNLKRHHNNQHKGQIFE